MVTSSNRDYLPNNFPHFFFQKMIFEWKKIEVIKNKYSLAYLNKGFLD